MFFDTNKMFEDGGNHHVKILHSCKRIRANLPLLLSGARSIRKVESVKIYSHIKQKFHGRIVDVGRVGRKPNPRMTKYEVGASNT